MFFKYVLNCRLFSREITSSGIQTFPDRFLHAFRHVTAIAIVVYWPCFLSAAIVFRPRHGLFDDRPPVYHLVELNRLLIIGFEQCCEKHVTFMKHSTYSSKTALKFSFLLSNGFSFEASVWKSNLKGHLCYNLFVYGKLSCDSNVKLKFILGKKRKSRLKD